MDLSDFGETFDEQSYRETLESVSTRYGSDPRVALVGGMMWWLLNRRSPQEMQRIRYRRFHRRCRRLLTVRELLARRKANGNGISTPQPDEQDLLAMLIDEEEDDPLTGLGIESDSEPPPPSGVLWNRMDQLTETEFREAFHVSPSTFEFLQSSLSDRLTKSNTSMREPLPVKKRLAATLYRLAHNCEYHKIASLFGIGKSTTTSLVREVCNTIISHFRDTYLTLNGDSESDCTAQSKTGEEIIPQCVGILGSVDVYAGGASWDDTHQEYMSVYSNKHALVFQAVVDSNTRCFTHISAGYPSSLTNEQVLDSSGLEMSFTEAFAGKEAKEIEGTLVPPLVATDDTDLESRPWILTPYSDVGSEDEIEQSYNTKLESVCKVFEKTVGDMQARWQIFSGGRNGRITFNAESFETIATACAILHNICQTKGDEVIQGKSEKEGIYFRKSLVQKEQGQCEDAPMRDAIASALFEHSENNK